MACLLASYANAVTRVAVSVMRSTFVLVLSLLALSAGEEYDEHRLKQVRSVHGAMDG